MPVQFSQPQGVTFKDLMGWYLSMQKMDSDERNETARLALSQKHLELAQEQEQRGQEQLKIQQQAATIAQRKEDELAQGRGQAADLLGAYQGLNAAQQQAGEMLQKGPEVPDPNWYPMIAGIVDKAQAKIREAQMTAQKGAGAEQIAKVLTPEQAAFSLGFPTRPQPPTETERKVALYRSDPSTFEAIFGKDKSPSVLGWIEAARKGDTEAQANLDKYAEWQKEQGISKQQIKIDFPVPPRERAPNAYSDARAAFFEVNPNASVGDWASYHMLRGLQNAPTPFKTFAAGEADKLAKAGVTDPGDQARAISSAWTMKEMELTEARGEGFAKARAKYFQIPVLDSKTGAIGFATAEDIMAAREAGSERFSPAGQSEKVLQRQTTLNEIYNSAKMVDDALKEMPEFTASQAALLANIFKDEHNAGMFASMVRQKLGTLLDPSQMKYAIQLANLEESAMALRQTQGLGQGSDLVREAIQRMIPNPTTPSKAYAGQQLSTLRNMLDVFKAGIPKLPGQGATGDPSKMSDQELLKALGQ